MLWIFLLQLVNSIKGLSGAEHETLCTSNACFTLHLDSVSFANASHDCVRNGGNLMTIRDRGEEDVLRSLLSQTQGRHQDRALQFWIGLKLNKGTCVLADKTLQGFEWISGERDSHYSNWGKEPDSTCTEDRCVRVHYTLGQNQLKWAAGGCKGPAFYACKFYFKGMCKPLALLGPGQITYTAPFSEKPERSEMKSCPLGTYVNIVYDVQCFCREGYDLDEDGHNCSDIDECQSQACEDHLCVNTHGSYMCTCKDGYKLIHGKCSDVDECAQSRCEHNYIDECKMEQCQEHCKNTFGSFVCSCKEGFVLKDEVKCIKADVSESFDITTPVTDGSVKPVTNNNTLKALSPTTGGFVRVWIFVAVAVVVLIIVVKLYVVKRQKRREQNSSQQSTATAAVDNIEC
uniref:C-type lectin domain-containing protein n=1 Tax=Seriola lalandi dorsalis TaxID=1841481 RepID=A0A3B4XV75_SERLL